MKNIFFPMLIVVTSAELQSPSPAYSFHSLSGGRSLSAARSGNSQKRLNLLLIVSNTPDGGKKTTQLQTDDATSVQTSVGALWGPKQLDNLADLDLSFDLILEKFCFSHLV
ncbi:hypothetical protein BJV74DRAFT_198039 [Russula compacta]|nr:hypothetical protein BJV74DRAFT_198039 [Russula compacta]